MHMCNFKEKKRNNCSLPDGDSCQSAIYILGAYVWYINWYTCINLIAAHNWTQMAPIAWQRNRRVFVRIDMIAKFVFGKCIFLWIFFWIFYNFFNWNPTQFWIYLHWISFSNIWLSWSYKRRAIHFNLKFQINHFGCCTL